METTGIYDSTCGNSRSVLDAFVLRRAPRRHRYDVRRASRGSLCLSLLLQNAAHWKESPLASGSPAHRTSRVRNEPIILQDGSYWPLEPMKVISLWLAVDESTVGNGCLRVVRGSHKEVLKASVALFGVPMTKCLSM